MMEAGARKAHKDELIKLVGVWKTYRMGELDVHALRDVSLQVARGEFIAIMGASGSGKTTLMNILGCLDRPSSGSYWLDGEEVSRMSADKRAMIRNRKIGFVFQNFNLLPRTSALENVAMPLSYTASHLTEKEARRRAKEVLERVGLGDRLHHEPSQLSGGQQQRVAIARALVNKPPLLLADEPTGNLDSKTGEEVLELFQELNREEGVTVVLVTHDPHVASHAERIIYIHDGQIVEDLPRLHSRSPSLKEVSHEGV
jgi:ABC-type lipoprotein export system ATPase subunit